jgi:hypothetical protein
MPPDTPPPSAADRAAVRAACVEMEARMRRMGVITSAHYDASEELIAAALAHARREGREAGRREAAEHCIGTLRAAADKARHLSRANDGSREGDACAWTADTLAELADRLAALPPPGEGGK